MSRLVDKLVKRLTRAKLESLVEKGYAWKHEPTGEYGMTEKGIKLVEELKREGGKQ